MNPLDLRRLQRRDRPAGAVDRCLHQGRRRQHRCRMGEVGELCIKGPQVMQGYWQRPEETAKVIDADGWLHTGDMAQDGREGLLLHRRPQEGHDPGVRASTCIRTRSRTSSRRMPGVLEVAAVGVPDDKSGEAVKVVIVKKDPALTADAGQGATAASNLTGYKQPRFVEFRDRAAQDQRRQDPAQRTARCRQSADAAHNRPDSGNQAIFAVFPTPGALRRNAAAIASILRTRV